MEVRIVRLQIVITHKLATLLAPLLLATTTVALTPQEGAFPVGVGEQRLTTYLEAPYTPSVEPINDPKTLVNEVFGKDADIMWNIAICESGGRQFNSDGSVIVGRITPDYGLFQINQVHLIEAKKNDINIFSLDGNVQFAKLLFNSYGTRPWASSAHCHGS
jgi:hypothetical protein